MDIFDELDLMPSGLRDGEYRRVVGEHSNPFQVGDIVVMRRALTSSGIRVGQEFVVKEVRDGYVNVHREGERQIFTWYWWRLSPVDHRGITPETYEVL